MECRIIHPKAQNEIQNRLLSSYGVFRASHRRCNVDVQVSHWDLRRLSHFGPFKDVPD
jgi:hypothetical protein